MKRRRLIYGTNALISVLSVCGILIILNYIFFKSDVRIDMTEGKLYTVSEHTVGVIENIGGDVEMLAFFKDVGMDRSEFQDLIKEYTRRSGKDKNQICQSGQRARYREKVRYQRIRHHRARRRGTNDKTEARGPYLGRDSQKRGGGDHERALQAQQGSPQDGLFPDGTRGAGY